MNSVSFGAEFLSAAEQPIHGGRWIKLTSSAGEIYFYNPATGLYRYY